jgi:hypothetical protein
MKDAEEADGQDSLEDTDRLDLDNSDLVEESMIAIVEDCPDPQSLEKEKASTMMLQMMTADKKVTPSPPLGIPPVVRKEVTFAQVAAGSAKPDKRDTLPAKNLASVFTAAATKPKSNSVFLKAMFPIEANPKDPVKLAHA